MTKVTCEFVIPCGSLASRGRSKFFLMERPLFDGVTRLLSSGSFQLMEGGRDRPSEMVPIEAEVPQLGDPGDGTWDGGCEQVREEVEVSQVL